jgi:transposase InsO family protein
LSCPDRSRFSLSTPAPLCRSSPANRQNAYVESFKGRLRDECFNQQWLVSLAHAQAVINAWVREYKEERPKKVLGGLAPRPYAKRMAEIGYPNPGV